MTSRGGPLVGEELLMLQGIPAADLILTRESEANLKDLAGNAMTTTVVGACILAAICAGGIQAKGNKKGALLPEGEVDLLATEETKKSRLAAKEIEVVPETLVPRSLTPAFSSDRVTTTTSHGTYVKTNLDINKAKLDLPLSRLLKFGLITRRLCHSECNGQSMKPSDATTPGGEFVICKVSERNIFLRSSHI